QLQQLPDGRRVVMRWITGVTTCPRCRECVYPFEDLFAVQEGDGRTARAREAGVYHYKCFRAAPFQDAYLVVAAAHARALVAAKARVWKTQGADEDFALVHKPHAGDYTLFFFRQDRELTFGSAAELRHFRERVVGHDGRPTPPATDAVRWQPTPDGWL